MLNTTDLNKILVIRYGTIGDTIFASAFFRELRNALPKAEIDILTEPISDAVMKNCPYINNRIFIDGKFSKFFKYLSIFKKYDAIYFLKNDNFFTKTAYFAGVKNRIGFNVKRNFKLTLKTEYNNQKHETDYYLDLLKISGINVCSDKTEVWLDFSLNKKLEQLIPAGKRNIVIQAYSRFSQKNWIDEYWCEVINYIIKNYDYNIIFAGGNSDRDFYNNLLPQICDTSRIINLSGQLTIPESMLLVNNSDFMIGIDSGLIHVAAALDKPSILLNGPTSIVRWKPRSDNCIVISENYSCSPCCFASGSKKLCKNRESDCMRAITPEKVINIIKTKLG